ncbi:MAG: glycosyl hydrolase [Tenericutes bacterium HGW-Tenericutes-6]|nr:MAG: glycosyl hydrolase [Tenericutes bacterium HGW-Tenericutes-6]
MIFPYGKARCYSGYREGQNPMDRLYPSDEEIIEDLKILEKDFDYIRMYDASAYTLRTLELIRAHQINLKVMLTMNLLGEMSNPDCSWGGKFTTSEIAKNIENNQDELEKVILYAHQFKDEVISVSAGNESVPEWNENLVSPGRVLYFVKELKKRSYKPVTYCDNVHYWKDHLKEVAEAVDFISIHLYPVWEGKGVPEAIDGVISGYHYIKSLYPNKEVIITETGWPTKSNHFQIQSHIANEHNQKIFNSVIDTWSEKEKVTCFFFEAFDETWKGSEDPFEPEKHWGYYDERRKPKAIKQTLVHV